MKNRLLVMNGQKIIQHEIGGQWKNDKVEKAGLLKPGIYNLYMNSVVDKLKEQEGIVVHSDKNTVYQQVGKSYISHNRADFEKVPEPGVNLNIKYSQGKAVVETSDKLARSLSR